MSTRPLGQQLRAETAWASWRISMVRQFQPAVLIQMSAEDLLYLAGQSPEGYVGQEVYGILADRNKVAQNAARAQVELEPEQPEARGVARASCHQPIVSAPSLPPWRRGFRRRPDDPRRPTRAWQPHWGARTAMGHDLPGACRVVPRWSPDLGRWTSGRLHACESWVVNIGRVLWLGQRDRRALRRRA